MGMELVLQKVKLYYENYPILEGQKAQHLAYESYESLFCLV
jgi:hypothetical protein